MARTANAKDYVAHMNLISPRVRVFGVPDFEVIDYDDWARQCKHEFQTGVLRRVGYDGCTVRAQTPTRIMFKTHETVEGSDGSINVQGIEVVIEREDDGVWRVTQERVLSEDEYAFDPRRNDA